jgi:hypothetical protein
MTEVCGVAIYVACLVYPAYYYCLHATQPLPALSQLDLAKFFCLNTLGLVLLPHARSWLQCCMVVTTVNIVPTILLCIKIHGVPRISFVVRIYTEGV